MKNGLRAWDSDTHVNPAAEVLERYVDPGFRPRLAELAPHRTPTGKMIGGTPDTHQIRVATKFYRRMLGAACARSGASAWMSRPRPSAGRRRSSTRPASTS